MTSLAGTIVIAPVLPLWGLLGATILAFALCWLSLAGSGMERGHRLGIWGLRAASILLVALLLLQPERRTQRREKQPPLLGVVVDASASMKDQPEALAGKPTRAGNACSFLKLRPVRRALDGRFRTRAYTMAAEAALAHSSLAELRFEGPRSHLTASLNAILPELSARGAVGLLLLSDGLDQSTAPLDSVVSALPILAVELEPPLPESKEDRQEVWITDLSYPKRSVVNREAGVRAVIRRRGTGPFTAPATLYREDHVLQRAAVRFSDAQQYGSVSFTIRPPEEGSVLYRLELKAPETDARPGNRCREFVVEVTDPESRVLYLEGTPRWEFKFLKRALLGDPTLRLSAYVQTGGGFVSFTQEGRGLGATMPALNRETLAEYKAVILGNLNAGALDAGAWQELEAFVDRGGGLLIAGGRRSFAPGGVQQIRPIRGLMPLRPAPAGRMQEGRFSLRFSDEGRSHPATRDLAGRASIPSILSVWRPSRASAGSTVLMRTAEDAPVLAVRRYGQGRVALFLSNTLWRWRLASAPPASGRHFYDAFMVRIVTWLLPPKKGSDAPQSLQLLTRESEAEVGARMPVGLATGGPSAPEATKDVACRVRTPEGRTLQLPLSPAQLGKEVGLGAPVPGFLGHFTPHIPGEYTLEASSSDGRRQSELRLVATRPSRERTGAPINRDYLQTLADRSHGAFVPISGWRSALARLEAKSRTLTTVRQDPLWTSPWWLALLIALFSLEWWWRRRLDLV